MTTKRIRIAVAMSRDGRCWSAQGWSDSNSPGESATDKSMMESCLDCVPEGADGHFVEVDIPLPTINPVAIEGSVIPRREVP